ncbi:hypothetical protein CEXT_426811 [Caerostris extrusa]|uniref:Uncharacterized protein n=1 Tax=Caerostris extrusa TaxID=172846 RepID=A0AAV4XNX9_CAEEX|nr:hypothetical protein CEXT_426811 [Caerostris extrusa]
MKVCFAGNPIATFHFQLPNRELPVKANYNRINGRQLSHLCAAATVPFGTDSEEEQNISKRSKEKFSKNIFPLLFWAKRKYFEAKGGSITAVPLKFRQVFNLSCKGASARPVDESLFRRKSNRHISLPAPQQRITSESKL